LLITTSAQPLIYNLVITNNSAYQGGGVYAGTSAGWLKSSSR